jgi:hypothetical protein
MNGINPSYWCLSKCWVSLKMIYMNKEHTSILKQISLYIIFAFVMNSFVLFAQIPERAINIADSVCQTRMYCDNTHIVLEDSIYYPIFKNEYQDRKTESHFFTYKIYFQNEIETDLNISIEHDFSIKYISGFPDSSYKHSPCTILSIKQLWSEAKKHGLKTKFKKCKYHLWFEKEGIFIWFTENKSRWDADHYTFNAITGEYIFHSQMNVTF